MVISKFYNSNAMSKVLICCSYHWRWKFSLSFRDCSVFWQHQCHDFLKARKVQLITDFMKFLKFNPYAILRMIFHVTDRKFIFLMFVWPLFNLTRMKVCDAIQICIVSLHCPKHFLLDCSSALYFFSLKSNPWASNLCYCKV